MALATEQLKPKVFELIDQGYSVRRIAKILPGVSKSTVQRFRDEWKQQKQQQEQAA